MSKKKLSKQQLQRISQKQLAYADKVMQKGFVITISVDIDSVEVAL
jgi:hypothetical protein